MGRLNDSDTGLFLFVHDLLMQLMHLGPMHFGFVVMFRMVSVVEPDQIINLIVAADAPCDWLVRIPAVMTVVTIQIREAVTEIIKRQIEEHKLPIQEEANDYQGYPGNDFQDSKVRIESVTLLHFLEDRFGVVPEKAQKNVRPDVLRFVVVAMFVDGNRIDGFAPFVRKITVTLMMLEMNQVIKLLGITHCYRQQPAEKSIGRFPLKVWIVNEIVSNPVDVPRDADGVNKAQDQHDPQRSVWKQKEH